jgi:hypothetical protein
MVDVTRGPGGLATLGLEMVVALVFALLGGMWLDGKLDTAPVFMWIGFAFGLATAARSVHRAMRIMRAIALREEREKGNPPPLYETEADRADRRRDAERVESTESDEERFKARDRA